MQKPKCLSSADHFTEVTEVAEGNEGPKTLPHYYSVPVISSRSIDEATQDHMCGIVELLPDSNVISAINCNEKYSSRVVCLSNDRYTGNLSMILEQQQQRRVSYSGFSIRIKDKGKEREKENADTINRQNNQKDEDEEENDNSDNNQDERSKEKKDKLKKKEDTFNDKPTTLLVSTYTCPEAYVHFVHHVCIKIIPFSKTIPSYATCSHKYVWNERSRYEDARDEFCREDKIKNTNILDIFDSVCKEDNATLLDNTDIPAIVSILEDVFSVPFAAIHAQTGKNVTAYPSSVGTPGLNDYCHHHVKCIKYPTTTHYKSLEIINRDLPHFTVCFKPLKTSSPQDLPLGFQTYNCGGYLIAAALMCDGKADCPNGKDECDCGHVCMGTLCFANCPFPECICHEFYYQCEKGGCVPFHKFCDGISDCHLSDDEMGCDSETALYASNATKGSDRELGKDDTMCDMEDNVLKLIANSAYHPNIDTDMCTGHAGILPCLSGSECYSIDNICQYDVSNTGKMLHCTDGTHLRGEAICKQVVCTQKYKCLISYCIPLRKVCNGVIDCPNGDDEMSCDDITCPGQVWCSGTKQCVIHQELCDGVAHCPRKDDELSCQRCPLPQCQCTGNMMQCHNVALSHNFAQLHNVTKPHNFMIKTALLHWF